jgi:alpha-tubulin suppressor-like RCC1 family protein
VSDGGVLCWGNADLVNLAHTFVPDDAASDPPMGAVPPTHEDLVPPAATIEVGPQVACVTSPSGTLSCWGRNENSQLGRGPTPEYLAPPAAATKGALAGKTVARAASGDSRTFAILSDGELVAWGLNGQPSSAGYFLGRDTSEDPDPLPTLVPGVTEVRAVAASITHTCAVAGRFVQCWGYNDQGQLGRGWFDNLSALPARTNLAFAAEDAGTANGADVPLAIAVGGDHSCSALGGGRVYCWGGNSSGQIGLDPATTKRTGQPVWVEDLSGPAVALAATEAATCALLQHGAVECWGSNNFGELGVGTLDPSPHPKPAPVTFSP